MAITATYLGEYLDPISAPILLEVVSDATTPDEVTVVAIAAGGKMATYIKQVSGHATINVADCVRCVLETAPITESDEWSNLGRVSFAQVADALFANVNAEVNPIGSKVRLLSDLHERIISAGEMDEISVSTPTVTVIDGITVQDNGGCVATRVIAPQSDFVKNVAGVTVRYKVIAPCGERLCWVNRYGAIDYWTFETVREKDVAIKREKMYAHDGWRTTSVEGEQTTTLGTRLVTAQTAHALAYILRSPKVWRVERDGTYTAIDIVTDKAEIYNHKEMSAIKIQYRPKIKI